MLCHLDDITLAAIEHVLAVDFHQLRGERREEDFTSIARGCQIMYAPRAAGATHPIAQLQAAIPGSGAIFYRVKIGVRDSI